MRITTNTGGNFEFVEDSKRNPPDKPDRSFDKYEYNEDRNSCKICSGQLPIFDKRYEETKLVEIKGRVNRVYTIRCSYCNNVLYSECKVVPEEVKQNEKNKAN